MADLRPAPPEFKQRISRLIAAYPQRLGHLRDARFEVLVRDEAPVIEGAEAWGEVDTPDDDAERAEFDFSIWFALDTWALLDDFQRDALTFHELSHCGWSADGKPQLLHHDVEMFDAELKHFGVWWDDAAATLDALRTMPPPHGAEGISEMPQGYQRPMRGSFGSGGAGSFGSGGAGSFGSGGAGSFGSGGAGSFGSGGAGSFGSGGAGSFGSGGARVAYSDPKLKPGDDYHVVDLGNGEVMELCPACFQAAAQSILSQLLAAAGGG